MFLLIQPCQRKFSHIFPLLSLPYLQSKHFDMSAYALPGLFPPVDNSFGFSLNIKPFAMNDFCEVSSVEEKVEFDPLQDDDECDSLLVSVKEARVDPLLLIQSLTKKATAASKRKLQRCNLRRRCDMETSSSQASQESAMEFVLNVEHEGRRYTAIRSLARIRALHRGLVKEAEIINSGSCPLMGHQTFSVRVPALPKMQDECGSLGFTLLQDVLRSYSPSLNKWFQEVLAEFPSLQRSPSLSDFFYEPASPQTNTLESLLPVCPRKKSLSRLDSITESDVEDEEKEEC